MMAGLPGNGAHWRAQSRAAFIAIASAAALALGACGDNTSPTLTSQASTSPAPSGGTNNPPTISGTPLTSVMEGTQYTFVPNAADADGDTLTFAISGRPSWATFDSATGKLSGTPSASDVGSYANITISVSDGSASATLSAFTVDVVATATGSATLSWTPPTQNSDGSPLTDLAGFKVYWGTSQGNYTNSAMLSNPGLTTYVVEQLTPATWYFVTTAVNSQGVESNFSNVASKTVM